MTRASGLAVGLVEEVVGIAADAAVVEGATLAGAEVVVPPLQDVHPLALHRTQTRARLLQRCKDRARLTEYVNGQSGSANQNTQNAERSLNRADM